MKTDMAGLVMQHATEMELRAVEFLDANGVYAKSKRNIEYVRYTFQDGKQFTLTDSENDKLSAFQFKLRPAQDNA
jgi:hypothetical protein